MKNQQKIATKTIYFTDISSLDKIQDIIGDNYQVFDRKKIISKSVGVNRSVFNYFSNVNLLQEFTTILKDKKISSIVYRLHYNNPDVVVTNIKENVIKKNIGSKSMKVIMVYIVRKENHDPSVINSKLYDQVVVVDI